MSRMYLIVVALPVMTKKDRIANKSKKENGIYLQDNLIFAVTLLTRLSVATKIACTHTLKLGEAICTYHTSCLILGKIVGRNSS